MLLYIFLAKAWRWRGCGHHRGDKGKWFSIVTSTQWTGTVGTFNSLFNISYIFYFHSYYKFKIETMYWSWRLMKNKIEYKTSKALRMMSRQFVINSQLCLYVTKSPHRSQCLYHFYCHLFIEWPKNCFIYDFNIISICNFKCHSLCRFLYVCAFLCLWYFLCPLVFRPMFPHPSDQLSEVLHMSTTSLQWSLNIRVEWKTQKLEK